MNLKNLDSEVLLNELLNRGYINVFWHRIDIEFVAKDMDVVLNEDEISFIKEDIEDNHDANYGLNWDIIVSKVKDVVNNREK